MPVMDRTLPLAKGVRTLHGASHTAGPLLFTADVNTPIIFLILQIAKTLIQASKLSHAQEQTPARFPHCRI